MREYMSGFIAGTWNYLNKLTAYVCIIRTYALYVYNFICTFKFFVLCSNVKSTWFIFGFEKQFEAAKLLIEELRNRFKSSLCARMAAHWKVVCSRYSHELCHPPPRVACVGLFFYVQNQNTFECHSGRFRFFCLLILLILLHFSVSCLHPLYHLISPKFYLLSYLPQRKYCIAPHLIYLPSPQGKKWFRP